MAFVGKPCDASALRALAKRDPRVAVHVPLILSFFCGGIPSHDGVGRILQTMGVSEGELRAFRYRGRRMAGQCVRNDRAESARLGRDELMPTAGAAIYRKRCNSAAKSVLTLLAASPTSHAPTPGMATTRATPVSRRKRAAA